MTDEAFARPVLPSQVWQAAREQHRSRAHGLLASVQRRRSRGEKHPVEDFLFEYYNLRPGQLEAWHPGVGVVLDDPDGAFAGVKFYVHEAAHSQVDVDGFIARRGGTLEWTRKLLRGTASRPAQLGCFGMHEWAMVYHLRPDQTRHPYLALRLSPDEVASAVESVGLRCSHFDAFRFFTDDAAPLNLLAPTREAQPELDQPGCLHANMDLYKWAGKLLPAVDSGLLLDTYELALDIRELDMRASAYDLTEWGYAPVEVETAAGRATYVREQKAFADRAEGLRARLLAVVDDVFALGTAYEPGALSPSP